MGTRLLTDQAKLPHQTTYLETANVDALVVQHTHEGAATRRTAAFVEQLVNLGSQSHSLSVHAPHPLAVFVVTGTVDIKGCAYHVNRGLLSQLVDQRVRFQSSDIKRAVAFFSMDFSISSRLHRSSSRSEERRVGKECISTW